MMGRLSASSWMFDSIMDDDVVLVEPKFVKEGDAREIQDQSLVARRPTTQHSATKTSFPVNFVRII